MENRLRSVGFTGDRLGVSPFTVRRRIAAGDLKAVRIGKRVMIPQSEIDRAIIHGCGSQTIKLAPERPATESPITAETGEN